MKKILLDTNVIIHREASTTVRDDIGLMFRWLDDLRYKKYIHKVTVSEINQHDDVGVRKTMATKLGNYHVLPTLAHTSPQIEKIGESDISENDRNDTLLLNEVHAGRVDYLITEDKALHKKAENLQIQGRIFRIDDFLSKVTAENPSLTEYKILSIRKSYFGDLDIDDQFFDSFKKDYVGFAKWFNKKSNDLAYVSKDGNGAIVAFLYLKTESGKEDYSDIFPPLSPKKRLKVGTLKVTNTGYKLGERFLKIIFDNAMQSRIEEIYVTVFENAEERLSLINLLASWGFVHHGIKKSPSGTEQVYVRYFHRFVTGDIKTTYPFVSNKQQKFIVPIKPKYHTELFPDSILSNESEENFLANRGHRNAIQKIFISRGLERSMCYKDILLFYRSGSTPDKQPGASYRAVVTTIGVVDSVVDNIRDEETFVDLCKKRSVFSDRQLRMGWNAKPHKPFLVNFLYICSLPKPYLNLAKMRSLNIRQKAPRSFELISNAEFNSILEHSNANKDFIVD